MESAFCFSLLSLLSSLSLVFSRYGLPDHYFINCGSSSATTFTGQNFVGDVKPTSFSVSGDHVATENNNPNTPPIYQTARVFRKKSWYKLQADQNNTFVMVRLHFSPFSSNTFKSFDSKFDVSISGFSLLSGFNVGNTTVIKEFIIPIRSERNFRIEFTPSQGSSFAFVNAIEAFTTPSNLLRDGDPLPPHISPIGNNGNFENLTSYGFNPSHRINVGGQTITVEDDTLRRNWVPDDPFIFNSQPARNSTPYGGQIRYQDSDVTKSDAPDNVYKTAKQLIANSNGTSDLFNITWSFGVNKNTMYLVRAHFCDIISIGLKDPNDAFNFFIYSHYKKNITPVQMNAPAVPFFDDFIVDSSDSGFVNISIGPIRNNNQIPFLNGLEIMELLKGSGRAEKEMIKKNKKSTYIVVGCVAGGVAFVLILLVGFLIRLKYRKVKPKPESHAIPPYGGDSYTSLNIDGSINHPLPIPNLNLGLRVPFADILQATNSFDQSLMIGRGGFGKVYKGTLPNGMKVAVKRGEKGHGQGRPEFVMEVMVLSRIRHRHLVSLIGYCDERSEMILVYEFMEKGTLQDHLYNANRDYPKLSWKQRLEICISATQGLHYLHTGSDGGVIHRDVKSTNILLNEYYVAKVADFGISRLDIVDQSEISDIKGSFGYLDPEYIRCLKLTQKSDVYSFGVVLLEVLCARPALDNKLPQKEANLADWAIRHIKNGEVEKIVDPFLVGTINTNSLRKFLDTVESCLKDTGDQRPSMVDVLWDLEYVLQLQETTVDREPHEDSIMNMSLQLPSIMNTSLQLSTPMLHRFPSQKIDESKEEDCLILSYKSESQVFSQLKVDEAR